MQSRLFRSAVSSATDLPHSGGVGLVEPAGPTSSAGACVSATESSWLAFSRKLLLSLLGIGAIGAVGSGGLVGSTAKFTATTVNAGNAFASGRLVLTNSSTGGSGSCTAVLASACGTVGMSAPTNGTSIAGVVSNLLPGNQVSGTINITNAGNLPAKVTVAFANLSGSANSNSGQCLDSTTGTGTCTSLTQILNLTLHDDSCTGCGSFAANYCIYGRSAGSPATAACDSISAASNQNTWSAVQSAPTTAIQIPGSLTSSSNRLDAGESHTFTLTVQMPSGASNVYQGGSATFDLVWQGSQS